MPSSPAVDVRISYLQWLVASESEQEARYRAYREYYDGEHDTALTARMREYLQIKYGEEFNANYCPIVVDALAERLEVTGFEAGEQGEELWQWWTVNRMDAISRIVHLAAIRDGDAYLLVGWDNDEQRPTLTFELAFDGSEGVRFHYNQEYRGAPEVASKRWRIDGGENSGYVRRLNLYFPNRIEKYASDQRAFEGAWQPYQPEGDTTWPLWWTRTGTEQGEPLGLPVIHFKNQDQGYNLGQSELKNVVPLQNALNKAIIDLLAAADTTAFRIFYMIGDNPSALKVSPGSWVYSQKPPSEASIGMLPGEDLRPLIDLKDSIAIEIARITRTPLSYFQISGHRPAEGTLKQEESGLIARAQDRQITFGNAWEDSLSLARRLWNVYSPGPELDENEIIRSQWAEIESRNELQHLESLKIKAELGVPREQLWREMEYNDDEIAALTEMTVREEQQRSNVGAELLRQFEQGAEEEILAPSKQI